MQVSKQEGCWQSREFVHFRRNNAKSHAELPGACHPVKEEPHQKNISGQI